MPLHDRVGHRQAEACPLPDRFGREERLENAVEVLLRNAAARVLETDPDLAAAGAGRDGDRPVRLDRVSGVDDQIEKHLVKS